MSTPTVSDLFAKLEKTDPRYDKASLAVVARGDAGCAVICHVGVHVAQQISDLGSNGSEVFDSDPPMGISIFEGRLAGGHKIYSVNGDDYADVYLAGTFRPPTDDEWAAIRAGDCPWDAADWEPT